MSGFDKIVWSEGMFLQPQHFQQHDRYLESLIVQRPGLLEPYFWGITHLKIDPQLLKLGKFALSAARGILPDGTAFDIPAHDKAPAPLDIPEGTVNSKIFLALPLRRAGASEAGHASNDNAFYRYQVETIEVNDSNAESDASVPVQIGKLNLQLLLENTDTQGYSCLSLAYILEARSDHMIVLDEQFIPPCLDTHAAAPLAVLLPEIQGLLHYRGNMLAQRLTEAGIGGVAEIADFMLLQLVNRLEPLFAHLATQPGLHPAGLYRLLIQLIGELATFTRRQRRPIALPQYVHTNLTTIFAPVIAELRRALSMVLEENAVVLKLVQQQPGTWVATLGDKALLSNSVFVLAVSTALPPDHIRQHFPAQIKIAPLEEIRNLVNRALPGIDLHALSVAPRQIPYHANFSYFALNHDHALWPVLEKSAGIAFHISGEFPGLRLELWAIKEKRHE